MNSPFDLKCHQKRQFHFTELFSWLDRRVPEKRPLQKGVVSAAADLQQGANITFLEVEPHSLTSLALGKSQREIRKFLEEVVTLDRVVDEVETLVADRSKMNSKPCK